MFRHALCKGIIFLHLAGSPAFATQQEDCISEVLEKGASYRSLSEIETIKIMDISSNIGRFAEPLKKIAEKTVVFNDMGGISHFVRFRRDEVFFTALYVCLIVNTP